MGNKIVSHILLPAVAPGIFFGAAAMPGALIGDRLQSLMILAIAFIGVAGAMLAGAAAVKGRFWGGKDTAWWVITSIILAIPALALMIVI